MFDSILKTLNMTIDSGWTNAPVPIFVILFSGPRTNVAQH